MRSRLGKLSVLMVTLLIAVGAMGAGFASWTDSLVINGFVTTADFAVGIVDLSDGNLVFDPGPNYQEDGGALHPQVQPLDGTVDPQWGDAVNWDDKNVASTNSYNVGDVRFTKELFVDTGVPPRVLPFYGTIREEIHNAYPWYASGMECAIGNAGDIPVHIVDIDFTETGGDCGVLAWLVLDSWEASVCTADAPCVVAGAGAGIAELEEFLSGWPDGVPFQLEPCETLVLTLMWHFEQEVDVDGDGVMDVLPQGADCEFEITIDVEQWAE